MKREIKFRGKCEKSNNWVFGDLIHGVGVKKGNYYILPDMKNLAYVAHCDPLDGVKVNPDTIGQLTGLKDKNKNDIYEGDIIKLENEWNNKTSISSVIYARGVFEIDYEFHTDYNITPLGWLNDSVTFTLIGNIYDNKEFLRTREQ